MGVCWRLTFDACNQGRIRPAFELSYLLLSLYVFKTKTFLRPHALLGFTGITVHSHSMQRCEIRCWSGYSGVCRHGANNWENYVQMIYCWWRLGLKVTGKRCIWDDRPRFAVCICLRKYAHMFEEKRIDFQKQISRAERIRKLDKQCTTGISVRSDGTRCDLGMTLKLSLRRRKHTVAKTIVSSTDSHDTVLREQEKWHQIKQKNYLQSASQRRCCTCTCMLCMCTVRENSYMPHILQQGAT